MRGWWDKLWSKLSARQNQVVAVGLVAGLFSFMIWLARYEIFGNDFGVAWATGVAVAMTYLVSSFVSNLALSAKLKKHNITHPQFNPGMTNRKIGLTVAISFALGIVVGTSAYLSPDTVDHSDFNHAVMIVMIAAAPTAAVILSWFDI